jgi:diguanylate cyclase (GGDEF)-like protein
VYLVNSKHREQIICDNQKIRNHNQILKKIVSGKPFIEILQEIVRISNLHFPDINCKISLSKELNLHADWTEVEAELNRLHPIVPGSHFEKLLLPLHSSIGKYLGEFALWSKDNKALTDCEREEAEEIVSCLTLSIERNESDQRLNEFAYSDSLTGLSNRRFFIEASEQALEEAKVSGHKFAILFFDFDRFKWINDRLGHDAGDSVLVEASSRLRANLSQDVVVARFGGDEFMALLKDMSDLTEIEQLVNNLQSTITKPMRLKNKDIQLQSSIGYALYPQHGNNLASLFEHADRAMYEVKHFRQRFNSKTSS